MRSALKILMGVVESASSIAKGARIHHQTNVELWPLYWGKQVIK